MGSMISREDEIDRFGCALETTRINLWGDETRRDLLVIPYGKQHTHYDYQ